MRTSVGNLLVFIVVQIPSTIQVLIHPAVTPCKRDNATIRECYCANFKKMIPILKDGAPHMRIPSLDPINVVNVVMDLTNLHSVHLIANLFNILGYGSSLGKVPFCDVQFVDGGMRHWFTLEFPHLLIDSTYNMVGTFANFTLNSTGNFHGEFKSIFVNSSWTGTKYMKNNKEHLDFNCKFDDFEVESVKLQFNKIFKDNPQMDDVFNDVVADNIHLISSEIIPIIADIIKSITIRMVDTVYDLFPYEVLFPPQ